MVRSGKGGDSTGAALEAAILQNPDDLAAHRAYADWLAEQGDLRGEFAQVQLALEDPTLDAARRAELQAREAELLEEHAEEWLGELADYLLGADGVEFRFARGWLDSLRLPTIRADLAGVLAAAPEVRLLRRLVIARGPDEAEPLDREAAFRTVVLAGVAWYEDDEEVAMDPLAECENLANLRVLQLGDTDFERADFSPRVLPQLLPKMPRLEELRLFLWTLEAEELFALAMPSLRVLQVAGAFDYPLEVLAGNESLGHLTHLSIEPIEPGGHQKIFVDSASSLLRAPALAALQHLQLRFFMPGDALCQEVVESGILRRLRSLDLQFNEITDEGARVLAACPDLRRLGSLDVAWNYLSGAGLQALRATGIQLHAEPQTEPAEPDEETDESME
jgi:uncharacterized protein (TIGR02996 family)